MSHELSRDMNYHVTLITTSHHELSRHMNITPHHELSRHMNITSHHELSRHYLLS